MRASETGLVGSAGELEVAKQFVELGWGVAPNPTEHDLGTDLWVAARDARRFDLGSLLGVQVKSGDSQFDSAVRDSAGQVEGWWYRESDGDHIDYWLNHQVPHIIVLHHLDTGQSNWVHVTPDRIVSTGKGYKILVPATASVAPAHAEALVEIVSAGRSLPRWDGSAWTGAEHILKHERLRYALLTPRLVAPHPNLHITAMNAVEAIALLVKMRREDLEPDRRRKTAAPILDECKDSPDWQWRFYAALHDILVSGATDSIDDLENLIATAPNPADRAAATAATAALLVEQDQAVEALKVLEADISRDEATPVDHAWLTVHRARILAETGRLDDARAEATEVQALRQTHPHDPTALAIASAATNLIFGVSDWNSQDLAETITSRDTHASWWRTQEVASGLQHTADESFARWASRRGKSRQASDGAWNHLRAASLIAGFSADHNTWRYSYAQLAKRTATVSSDPGDAGAALSALRTSGDVDAIKQAVPHLLDVGPTSAVKDTAESIDLARSTRTTLDANLELMIHSADVLSENTADRCIDWALDTLPDPGSKTGSIINSFHSILRIHNLIAAVAPAASPRAIDDVISKVTAAPEMDDQAMAHEFAKILRSIPEDAWTTQQLDALASRAASTTDNFEFTEAATEILAAHDTGTRTELIAKIAAGDLSALHAYGDVRDLPSPTVECLTAALETQIAQQIEDLTKGHSTIATTSTAATLILLNAWHPDHARWARVIELLQHFTVFTQHLKDPLQALRRHAANIPQETAQTLIPILRTLMAEARPEHSFFGGTDIRSDAAAALGALAPDSLTDKELWALLAGDPDKRASAALAVAQRNPATAIHSLTVMAHDTDPWVRAVVANSLARWMVSGQNDAPADALLTDILDADAGTLVARMVSVALRETPVNEATLGLAERLASSPSATVRADVRAVLRPRP